jgi:hypothetical protein
MWEKIPLDWPFDVAYVDPNNNLKTSSGKGSKPTKDLLIPMLKHLIKKYNVSIIEPLFDYTSAFFWSRI